MLHRCVNSTTFNYLTIKDIKKGFLLTGETNEGIEKGDEILHPWFNERLLVVDEITERRDSKSFPKGNNMFYSANCSIQPVDKERWEELTGKRR